MKKLISFIMAITLCLSFSIPVAATNGNGERLPASTMTGYLVDDAGQVTAIIGHLVEKRALSNDGNEATYSFQIASADGTLTESSPDSGNASVVYLTINYSTRNAVVEYLLTSVSGYWVINDPQVSVTAATLTYGCSGLFPSPTTQNATKFPSNNFSYSTGFSDYVVNDGLSGVLGAWLQLTYQMGSSRTWTFTLQNNLF